MRMMAKAREHRDSLIARREGRAERDANPVTRWEYRVARIGSDKQKGLLGSRRMEEILDSLGAEGWELVTINMERATFKRQVTSISQAELDELDEVDTSEVDAD